MPPLPPPLEKSLTLYHELIVHVQNILIIKTCIFRMFYNVSLQTNLLSSLYGQSLIKP